MLRQSVKKYSTVSNIKKLVKHVDGAVDRHMPHYFQVLWHHPAGLKTTFFWAPLTKWGLVLAGLSDLLTRRSEDISLSQTASLMISGAIWSRYSVVIIPVNYMLFSVNMFVALIQTIMFARCLRYQWSIESTLSEDQKEHGKFNNNNKKAE